MAWTTPRTWVTDELVTAALMNTHIRDNLNAVLSYAKIKTADESVTSSTVLQSDDTFFFPVAINESWLVQLILRTDAGTGDLKFNWSVPASTTYFSTTIIGTATVTPVGWTSGDSVVGLSAANDAVMIWASFIVAATAGTITFQWAQNSSSGTASIVKAHSFMLARRISS